MWTSMQERVISARGNNLLVSAAAGSGKTAVLVERIATMIIEQNVSVDELVVVTFTNAAAAEMKDRIRKKLEEKLETDPDNSRIADQITLLGNAMISTIHSFCLNLIRENFLEAGVDPAFRTAESGEVELIESELLQDIIEKHYLENDKAFVEVNNVLSPGKNDRNIEEIIMSVYRYAKSYPWPVEWLERQLDSYNVVTQDELESLPVVQNYEAYVKSLIGDYIRKYDYIIGLSNRPDGPGTYTDCLVEEKALFERVLSGGNVSALIAGVNSIDQGFGRLKSAKEADKSICEEIQSVRNAIKKAVKSMKKGNGIAGIMGDIESSREIIQVLVSIAGELYMAVQARKQEKNIIDFNDMEHIALNLLVKKENDSITYSETADRLAKKYKSIMVDEYQDSNYLQEYILQALSSERFGNPDMFMVGDVKQSIYGFRQAKPQLFVDKYHKYESDGRAGEKIELQVNFRSREEVLDAANEIFFAIMKEFFGGIEYNYDVKLNPGSEFAPAPQGKIAGGPCEVILVDTGSEEDMELLSAKAEAAAVAEKILEYTGNNSNFVVQNESRDGYRRARYGDIAILLRSDGGWFEIYANVLLDAGIPVSVETRGGYFDTMECKLVMDVLACIDNPYQDISLAGVMTSYFGGFTYEEMAQIRAGRKESYLYENLLEVSHSNEKVRQLLNFFDELKEVMNQGNLYDLLWQIVHLSGYYDYAGMMPAGGKRQANLDALILKARSFENSQMKGLFNFLRYIRQIGKYSIDTGDVGNSFDEDAVRITTIHKSKGLEYPIVFVGKTMHNFNFQDTKKTVLIDSELGIGTYSYNSELRARKNTFYRDVISKNMIAQSTAEEIRVLYVALTRAKEKLILVGASEQLEKKLADCEFLANQLMESQGSYMYSDLMGCNSFYKMYLPVALNDKVHFSISIKKLDDLKTFVTDGERDVEDYDEDAQERTAVEPYPYEKYTSVRSKFSVSEIKHMSHASDEDDHEKPSQLLGKSKGFLNVQGAARGTAYHRVMECLDYEDFNQETDNQAELEEKVTAQIASMVSRNLIPAAEADTVVAADIAEFIASDLGKRVARAAALGLVKREQPFVYGVRAGDLICYSDIQECDELVLIQGEIDLYFFEGDKIILVDYKTDRVNPDNGREHLENMYREQLKLYGDALQQIIGSKYKVEEKIIYSFTLGEYFQV